MRGRAPGDDHTAARRAALMFRSFRVRAMTDKRNPRQPSQRQLRVGEELRHVLAEMLERHDFRDPTLAEANITVTSVDASPDLKNATVFVVPLGGGAEQAAEIVQALNRAAGFIRRRIAGQMRMKYLPSFSFQADASFDHAGRIDALLHDPKVARDLAPPDDED